MFLNISQHILHVVLVTEVLILLVVIGAAPISVTSCWKFHVHYRLIGKIFLFRIVFWALVVRRIAIAI